MMSLLWYWFVRALLAGLLALPMGSALRLAQVLSRLACRLDGPHRARAIEHLRRAYGPALSESQARIMARRVFETMGRHVCEAMFMFRRPHLRPRIENAEALLQAYAQGKGVVIITAHMGSFALLNLIPRQLKVRAAVILKRQKNRRLLAWVRALLRDRLGVEVVLKPEARERVAKMLRAGWAMTFFADQHSAGGGYAGTFFSHPCVVPAGPTIFAKRCGAPIVVVTIAAEGPRGSVARFEGPIATDGTPEEVTLRWNRILEEGIRRHPEQWMWMHRRWRGEPASSKPAEATG